MLLQCCQVVVEAVGEMWFETPFHPNVCFTDETSAVTTFPRTALLYVPPTCADSHVDSAVATDILFNVIKSLEQF